MEEKNKELLNKMITITRRIIEDSMECDKVYIHICHMKQALIEAGISIKEED